MQFKYFYLRQIDGFIYFKIKINPFKFLLGSLMI